MAPRMPTTRFINRDGTSNVRSKGRSALRFDEFYRTLLTTTWPRFFALVVGWYVFGNAIFAGILLLDGDAILNARRGSFLDAYFFSIQTMMTIGYGVMAPKTTFAHVIVSIEALTGMLTFGVATSLMFARFSRPRARVVFSQQALVAPREGVSSLMFRMANDQRSHIVEAELHVVLSQNETTLEGDAVRRFHDLVLSRDKNSTFALSWTAIHPLDERSPLRDATPESMRARTSEVIVSLTGIDEVTMQTVHARSSYTADDIVWGGRFADIIILQADGQRTVDYSKFHEVEPALPREDTLRPSASQIRSYSQEATKNAKVRELELG